MYFASSTLLVPTILVAHTVLATRREYAIVSVKLEDYKTFDKLHLDLLADENSGLISDLGAFTRMLANGYETTKSLIGTLNAFAEHGFEVVSTVSSGEALVYTLAKTV